MTEKTLTEREWLGSIIDPAMEHKFKRIQTLGGAHVTTDGIRLHAMEAWSPDEDEDELGFEDAITKIAGTETEAAFAIDARLLREALPDSKTRVHIRLVDGAVELSWWEFDDEGRRRYFYACIATMTGGNGPKIVWRPFDIEEEDPDDEH